MKIRTRSALQFFGFIVLFFSSPWLAAQVPVNPTLDNAKKVGSIVGPQGVALGNCFYIDQRGYVATTFSNVEHATEGNVIFNSGNRFPIAGVVVASRSKDIVILALRGVPEQVPPLTLKANAVIKVDDKLMSWTGPLSTMQRSVQGPLANSPAAKVNTIPCCIRLLRGDEYLLGMPLAANRTIGIEPNLEWFWLDQPRHRSCSGAPVFDPPGDVVGMMSGCLDKESEIISAIHVKHIVDLIPVEAPKLLPMANLRNWTDPTTLPNKASDTETETLGYGGNRVRGQALAVRYQDALRRHGAIEQEIVKAAKSKIAKNARILELLTEIDKQSRELAAIVPEETYQEIETRRVSVEIERSKKEKEKGAGREYEDREVREVVTRRRYSARQLTMVEPLQLNLSTMRSELSQLQAQLNTTTKLEPYFSELKDRIADELFYLADPLGLRPAEDHQALVACLTKIIEEGGAPATHYLVRAMSLTNLADYEKAKADLGEALDINPKLRALTQLVEARHLILAGKITDGLGKLNKTMALDKTNPQILFLAARGAMDAGNLTTAVQCLTLAIPYCPDIGEVRLGLGWLYAIGPVGTPKQAVENAETAVRLSGGQDWNSLSALAAAHARAKNFEKAMAVAEAAVLVSPTFMVETCRAWQSQYELNQEIKRLWK